MVKQRKSGVLCLEGPWSSLLTDESSVRPVLELLANLGTAKFIFRDAATIEELTLYLHQWTQKQYRQYSIGYLAFHGGTGGIFVGSKFVELDELAEILEGRCSGRVLHFDSCGTLDVRAKEIESFRRITRARAVCGFTNDVDWLESTAFALNLLGELTSGPRADAAFKRLKKNHAGACSSLGFRAVWNGGRLGFPGRKPARTS